jgi:hypothetical protein
VNPQPETYWGNVNPIGPRGAYDEAKRHSEAMAMAYHSQQGVDTAIARIFNTYGPRMRPNDGRAVPTFVRQALEGKPLTVFGDGTQTRSFCYVTKIASNWHIRRRRAAGIRPGRGQAIQAPRENATAAIPPMAANPMMIPSRSRGRVAATAASAMNSGKSAIKRRGKLTSGTTAAGVVRMIAITAIE